MASFLRISAFINTCSLIFSCAVVSTNDTRISISICKTTISNAVEVKIRRRVAVQIQALCFGMQELLLQAFANMIVCEVQPLQMCARVQNTRQLSGASIIDVASDKYEGTRARTL